MEDFLRIPFVLLALTAILVCYFLDQRRNDARTEDSDTAPDQRHDLSDNKQKELEGIPHEKHKNIRDISLAIAIGFLAFAILIFASTIFEIEKYIYEGFKEPFPDYEKSFFLKRSDAFQYMGLGLIYGVVIYGFYRFVLKDRGNVSNLVVAIWVVFIVLITAVGLFGADAKKLLASISRLETPAGSIEFAAVQDKSEISFSYGDADEAGSFGEADTDFQAGVKRLEATLDSVTSDFKKVVRFCRDDLMGGPFCAPFVGVVDAENVADKQEGLVTAMAVTYGYARAIKPISLCLNAYACFFENGVPIQGDLSEIAGSYATPPPRPLGCPGGGRKDPVCEPVGRIINHLDFFRNQAWGEAARKQCDYLEHCLNKDNKLPTAEDVISHRDAVRATGFILPYRSMLSAALLTASGYPREAVGHMEREYKKLIEKFGRRTGGGKESPPADFVESILRLRLLNGLQQVSAHAKKKNIALKYQQKEIDFSMVYLRENMSLEGEEPAKLLERCASNDSTYRAKVDDNKKQLSKEFREILNDEELIRKNMNSIMADSQSVDEVIKIFKEWSEGSRRELNKEWDAYVNNFLWYLVSADFRRLQARAGTEKDEIEDVHLKAAEKWWNIVIRKPNLIRACFSRMPFEIPGLYKYIKFQMIYTYGLLNGQKASWLSQKAELASSGLAESYAVLVDIKEIKKHVCDGYAGLRRAYNSGKALMEEYPDWTTVVEPQVRGASSMLRRLSPYVKWLQRTEGECPQPG